MLLTGLLARLGLRHREHVTVARDFSIYSAVNIVSLVLWLGTGLFLRRYLGPVFAGIWALLDLLPAYAQYAHLGVLNAAERDLPFLLGAQRTGDFERRKQTLFWLSHGVGLLLGAALAIGALVTRSRLSSRPLFVGLIAYAPLLWTQILAAYYVVLYRARKRFIELGRRQGLANLVRAAVTMALGYGFGLYGVFAALLVASATQVTLLHTGLDERFERRFDRTILWPMVVAGMPMLVGAVLFETIRNANQIVIGSALGVKAVGVYSVTHYICQGMYYLPNALAVVMFPRFQERYGETQSAASLRPFVELPLKVLADALLAATAVLLVALPPAITAYFPEYVDTIGPLRVMLVGTYFLCLSLPAGQFLLTIHKQTPALLIQLPATALALAAGYVGASYGLVGVAAGVTLASFALFLGVNVYAFAQFSAPLTIVRRLVDICGTAALVLLVVWAIEIIVPLGPAPVALVGGWRLVAAILVAVPLLVRAGRGLRSSTAQ